MTEQLDVDHALWLALGHPLRRALVRLCLEEGERLSPKELALVTRQPLSNVSYHARKLKEHGALEIAHEEPVRGAIEHFYEPTPIVKETPWVWAALGLSPSLGEAQPERLSDELRTRIEEHIAARREDPEFMARLNRLLGKDDEQSD